MILVMTNHSYLRVGCHKKAIAPKQRKTTQELDERTEARHSATYTIGRGEATTVRKPCTRSCMAGHGPRTTCYHQQAEPPSLTVEPWPTNQPRAPATGTTTSRR
jgi:hypothetical protein